MNTLLRFLNIFCIFLCLFFSCISYLGCSEDTSKKSKPVNKQAISEQKDTTVKKTIMEIEKPKYANYRLFNDNFVDLGDGIVYDNDTKLLWPKNPNVIKNSMQFERAFTESKELSIAGIVGWRIPTNNELRRMLPVYFNIEKHPFYEIKKHDYYWTSTIDRGHVVVDFSADSSYYGVSSSETNSIWPVRGK